MTLLGRVRNEIDLWTLSLWLGRRGRGVVVAVADEAVRPTAAGLWLRGPAA
jgi:hypothetical protein